jgi:sugar/nucleoside kinase (ribokinase family)
MKKNFDVLVVGELNVDLILNQLEGFPEVGKEIIARQLLLTLGSSSAIFASNLSVLGSKVAFCGRIGKDNFGDKILHDLAARGVDTSPIIHSDTSDTGVTIAINVGEDRAMVTYPGAMNELCADDITDELLLQATHLHVSSVFLQPRLKPSLAGLFKRARRLGLTTSLDPQWDPAEKWDLRLNEYLPYLDIFLPNIGELTNLVGKSSLQDCIAALEHTPEYLVVKQGNDGASLWHDHTLLSQPPFLNTAVVDAVGAGDSFNAGFIHQFLRGASKKACLEFGALCGAVNTTAAGGTSAFTDHETFRRTALEKFNYRT